MKEYNHKLIAELVMRSAHFGDSNAFAQLYALTYDKTYHYAYQYFKDVHLAQDALQEIYIRALKNISRLDDPTLFVAWLNRISFHVCYDISQRNSKEQALSPELFDFVEKTRYSDAPETQYEKKSELLLLKHAVNSLPFLEKEVITMRFYQNMKLEEIADALSVSRSTVKRYLASAQKKLKNIMTGKGVSHA